MLPDPANSGTSTSDASFASPKHAKSRKKQEEKPNDDGIEQQLKKLLLGELQRQVVKQRCVQISIENKFRQLHEIGRGISWHFIDALRKKMSGIHLNVTAERIRQLNEDIKTRDKLIARLTQLDLAKKAQE